MTKKLLLSFFTILIFLNISCNKSENKSTQLDKIKKRGKIVAITGYNAYSYFIYKGQPMGFEYELLNQFGDYLGVEAEIKVVKNITDMFKMLNNKKGDLIAFNLTVTNERSKKVAFTRFTNTTTQVLVQRRPKKWQNMTLDQINKLIITNPIDLEGKTVYVRSGSSYISRLKNLSDEIGGKINIKIANPDLSTENLIEMVSNGEIDYTISDENIAHLNQASFPDIDISTKISLPQKIAWAVRKQDHQLLDTLNFWIDNMLKNPVYYVIYNRYYENRNSFRRRSRSEFLSVNGSKISEYDSLLKVYAKKLNWDWRLLAAQIYEESQFNPEAKSWAGAVGLMQLMPNTAKQFGIENRADPKQSLKAGIKYLEWLNKYWGEKIEIQEERIKFVLASYNIGLGHIVDAQKLTEKYGGNPKKWNENVEFYLLQKSKKKFYDDEVVTYGYSSGIETVEYVKDVLGLYDHYKKFISSIKQSKKTIALNRH